MSQQINLLNPALLKKKDLLNPINIVGMFGVVLVALTTFGVYKQISLNEAKAIQTQSTQTLAEVQSTLTQLRANDTDKAEKDRLLAQIEQLENKEAMQEAMLEAGQHDKSHQGQSYAALLKAFARQSQDGLWITALSIDQDAQHLSISGRTMDPDLVPAYIARLRKEKALQGKRFTNLTMQYKEAKQQEQAKAPTEQQSPSAQVTTIPVPAQHSIPYIEFTLHSEPEDKIESIGANTLNAPKVAGAH